MNSTFWLSGPFIEAPLNSASSSPFVPNSKVHQEFFFIDVFSSNSTLDEEINSEINLLKHNFTNFNITESIPTAIANNSAHKIVFTVISNITGNPIFGRLPVKGMEFLTIKDHKLYEIGYGSELANNNSTLPIIEKMINSFTIYAPLSINALGNNFLSYENPTYKLKVQYPASWIKTHRDVPGQVICFFSPISGPYLLHKEYLISIDVNSVYDSSIDYVTRIVWDITNQTWNKTVEEASSNNLFRIIDVTPYSNFFEKGENYVLLPLDLSILNYPQQYQMIFDLEEDFIKDGHLCTLMDASNQVSSPPPEFSIVPSTGSFDIRPGEIKNVEIKVQSHTNIPSQVSFLTGQILGLTITINPNMTNVFPSGWSTVGLTVTNNGNTFCYILNFGYVKSYRELSIIIIQLQDLIRYP